MLYFVFVIFRGFIYVVAVLVLKFILKTELGFGKGEIGDVWARVHVFHIAVLGVVSGVILLILKDYKIETRIMLVTLLIGFSWVDNIVILGKVYLKGKIKDKKSSEGGLTMEGLGKVNKGLRFTWFLLILGSYAG